MGLLAETVAGRYSGAGAFHTWLMMLRRVSIPDMGPVWQSIAHTLEESIKQRYPLVGIPANTDPHAIVVCRAAIMKFAAVLTMSTLCVDE